MKIGIGVFGAVLVVALLALLGHLVKRPAKVAPGKESEAQRSASIRAAFAQDESGNSGGEAVVDAALKKQVSGFFTELGLAFANENDRKLASMFDLEAMVSNVEQQGYARIDSADRQAILGVLGKGIGPQMAANSEFMGFHEHALHRVEQLTDRDVVAYMRYWMSKMQVNATMRWWLRRDDEGQWRVYDYEDLNQGIRSSAMLGSIIASKSSEAVPFWLDGMEEVLQHLRGDLLPDLQKNRRVLRTVDMMLPRKLPAAVEKLFRVARIRMLVDCEDHKEALEEIARLERIDSSLPLLHHHRGVCYTELGEHPDRHQILHPLCRADGLELRCS